MRRAAAGEDGLSLIEVVVAALMLALVGATAAAFFVTGNDNAVASQRQSQLLGLLGQQMQVLRQDVKTLGFNKLAMSGSPSALPSGFPSTSYASTINADPGALVASASGCGSSNQELLLQANDDNTAEGIPSSYSAGGTPSTIPLAAWAGCTSS